MPSVADSLHSDATSLSHFHRTSLRATTFDGKTIYMKRKMRIEGLRNVSASKYSGGYFCPHFYQKSGACGHRMGNLLDVPIHRLMDELSAITAAKLAHPYVFIHDMHSFFTYVRAEVHNPNLPLRLVHRFHLQKIPSGLIDIGLIVSWSSWATTELPER